MLFRSANEWVRNVNNSWTKKTSGSTRKRARRDQKAWFDRLVQDNKNSRIKSYFLTNYEQFFRNRLEHNNPDSKKDTDMPEFMAKPLTGKLKSKATTEYGKIIANGNITINSGNVKNKDSLISGGGSVNINATNFENSVTVDDKNPIQLKKGKELMDITIYTTGKGIRKKIHMKANYDRSLVNGDIAYAAGQPSIIEGSVVNIKAANIIKNPSEYGNGEIGRAHV